MENTINILQRQNYRPSLHKKINLQSKRSLYFSIFFWLLYILSYHSWGLQTMW